MSYGPDAVHELVVESGWSYPVSVNRLEREYAMENVEIDEAGNSMMLAELLSRTDADRFESREDMEQKLGPVCERESRQRAGLLGRLKRALGL